MMSDDQRPLDHPHSTIGVQDLITLNASNRCGFLRKRGKLERIADAIKIVKPLIPPVAKWRQRFVVLSRGCIYVFADEFATSPSQAFALNGYLRVVRHNTTDGRERWSFEIQPEDTTAGKLLIFGCATEEERKSWMYAVREQMLLSNSIRSREATSEEKGDYIYLEGYVKQPQQKPPQSNLAPKTDSAKKKMSPLPAAPADDDDDEESDESGSDYDQIPEEELENMRANVRSPPAPKQNSANNVKQEAKSKAGKAEKPVKAPKPVLTKQLSRKDFEYKSSDRKEVESILQSKPVGTFLVRQSRSDDREVLSVKTEDGIKEYKIYNDAELGFSLDNQSHFNSVEKLVEHYMKNALPNRTMSLSRAFSMPED